MTGHQRVTDPAVGSDRRWDLDSCSVHPEAGKFGYPIHHVETREQWRAWVEAHHGQTRGVWLCSWRTSTGRSRCPYPEVVEEAICFGWIDSTASVLDDDRGLQLITPRNAKSPQTPLNRQRAAQMEAAGQMTDSGRRSIDIARNGWWTIYDPVEDLIEPDALAAALIANPAARASQNAFPPSARKLMLWWVISATKIETQHGRIDEIVTKAAAGERARRQKSNNTNPTTTTMDLHGLNGFGSALYVCHRGACRGRQKQRRDTSQQAQ